MRPNVNLGFSEGQTGGGLLGPTHDTQGRYFLPIGVAARKLGRSWNGAIMLVRRGWIIGRCDGGRWFLRADSVDRFVARHGKGGRGKPMGEL